MSADRLREAAKVLRERAERVTPGPWEAFRRGDADGPFGVCAETVGDLDQDVYYGSGRADAIYIATMHPGVGLALADWLDTAANNAERNGWMAGYTEAMRGTSAVRIADLILGGDR